ncbi:MAG: carbohydrate ABC transporter permease [Oscillospiraceae bacterium]|nr:carbohydrate ABC transporter permease [Oscillospiraceae bacterium]
MKHSDRRKGNIIVFLFLTVLGIFMALPIYLAFLMAFKPEQELFVFPPKLYTLNPTPDNFRNMLHDLGKSELVPFSRYFFNSVFVTVSVTVLQCVFSAMAGFVLAKCRFAGKNFLNAIIVISLLYQSNVIYIMQYVVMAELNIINTYGALIFPLVSSSMSLFLMRQSISQVPDEIIEAGKIDGAGLFRICWQIVIPNQKPAFSAVMIFAFQSAWNMQSSSFVYKENFKTLPTVIQQITASGISKTGITATASVIMLLPPVILFIFARKGVIETMAHSGISG